MGRDRRNEERPEQFTKWIASHRQEPAWKALTFPAREAYFHLRVRCFADAKTRTNNNGEVYRAPSKLAADMGCNEKTACRALADLQSKGWMVCTQTWERGYDGKGRTALWRLTEFPTAKKPATMDFKHWAPGADFEVEVYASAQRKKQNPPPQKGSLATHKRGGWSAESGSSYPQKGSINVQNRGTSYPFCGGYLVAIPSGELGPVFDKAPPASALITSIEDYTAALGAQRPPLRRFSAISKPDRKD